MESWAAEVLRVGHSPPSGVNAAKPEILYLACEDLAFKDSRGNALIHGSRGSVEPALQGVGEVSVGPDGDKSLVRKPYRKAVVYVDKTTVSRPGRLATLDVHDRFGFTSVISFLDDPWLVGTVYAVAVRYRDHRSLGSSTGGDQSLQAAVKPGDLGRRIGCGALKDGERDVRPQRLKRELVALTGQHSIHAHVGTPCAI